MNQHQPESTHNRYSKIGGWLILIAIGLVLSPIFILLFINSEILPVFSAVPLSELSSEFRTYLFFDLAVNLIFFIYIIVVMVLFFKRRRMVPKLMILLYLINLVLIIVDGFVFRTLNETQWIFGIINGIATSLIWIPYFLVSRRVKATFVV